MSRSAILPTPAEMKAQMDRFVVGQHAAKEQLATAVYAHYLHRAAAAATGEPTVAIHKENALLIGPSGCGKSHLVRTLANLLGVPVAHTIATRLSEVGYVGDNPEVVVQALFDAAGGDIARAESGIVIIDEIDKLRRQETGSRDVSGQGVQHALLSIIEGSGVKVQTKDGLREVNTTGVLFVGLGAFVGLDEIIRDRVSTTPPVGFGGFGLAVQPAASAAQGELDLAEPTDLIRFGFAPEFVGRFSTIAHLQPLGTEEIAALLASPEDSLIRRESRLCELHGIELEVTPDALRAIAERALRDETGARGATRITRQMLLSVRPRLPELAAKGVNRITISDGVVRGAAAPSLAYGPAKSFHVDLATLRRTSFSATPKVVEATTPRFTDPRSLTREQLCQFVAQTRDRLDWNSTTGSARKWWLAFENEQAGNLGIVLRLAEELAWRKATITEFFLAYVYSNTDNIQANLHYLDYTRLKKAEEQKKREQAEAVKLRSIVTAAVRATNHKDTEADASDAHPDADDETTPESNRDRG